MKTRVVNRRKERGTMYIGRGSSFGNPFVIGKDGTREECIEKYRRWLLQWLQHEKEVFISGRSNKWIIEHLGLLKGEILECYCKPEACHGDILVELIEGE